MRITSRKDLGSMSFIDFKVLDTSLDKISKSVMFSLSGALKLINGVCCELGEGFLKITQYGSIHITSYNALEKKEVTLYEDNFEPLRELCEIDIDYDRLVIKGFAKNTDNWIEFDIRGGIILGEFLDQKS